MTGRLTGLINRLSNISTTVLVAIYMYIIYPQDVLPTTNKIDILIVIKTKLGVTHVKLRIHFGKKLLKQLIREQWDVQFRRELSLMI